MQMTLLPLSAIAAAELPTLTIEPVPPRLAIAPGRYYIRAAQGEQIWDYPIQFQLHEIQRIFPSLEKLDWSLDADGTPTEAGAIHATIERLVGGAA